MSKDVIPIAESMMSYSFWLKVTILPLASFVCLKIILLIGKLLELHCDLTFMIRRIIHAYSEDCNGQNDNPVSFSCFHNVRDWQYPGRANHQAVVFGSGKLPQAGMENGHSIPTSSAP